MELNELPADYAGPQKRQTKFESPEAKLTYDAQVLIAKAEPQSERLGRPVDPITIAQREDDNIWALQAAINKELGVELSPEQILWLGEFKTRFDALSKLHPGILWRDVEKSLKADPEAMGKLQALDKKGHKMNVFGEEGDEFIFVSAWDNYWEVASDHRNIPYDPEGQRLAEWNEGTKLKGNAVSIIAKIMRVAEDDARNYLADPKFHEQLRREIELNGSAWLKTDADIRKAGYALCGHYHGTYRGRACDLSGHDGSFRVELRVKKVLNGFVV